MHMTITMASKSEPTDVAEIMLKIVPETATLGHYSRLLKMYIIYLPSQLCPSPW